MRGDHVQRYIKADTILKQDVLKKSPASQLLGMWKVYLNGLISYRIAGSLGSLLEAQLIQRVPENSH